MLSNINNNFKVSVPSMLLICVLFVLSTITSLVLEIPVASVMKEFNYSVIVIMVVMELFTNLVAETGIMQHLATRLAILSKGDHKKVLVLFGLMMFFVSGFLNNITATIMVLPVIVVLLKALNADKKYICLFFSVILALSNTGGSSTSIGDFPAVLIMNSGIITFADYTFKSYPLALVISLVLIGFWTVTYKKPDVSEGERLLAVDLLYSRYENNKVKTDILIPLGLILAAMFVAWITIPQNIVPPEVVLIIGYSIALVVSSVKGIKVKQSIDMKAVLMISSFLFMATVISASGVLVELANILEASISNPKALLLVIMFITSVLAGLVSAGPASAAMLPVVIDLCQSSLAAQSNWVVIAFAASICAGSSLFMWSATAGFILSGKVSEAKFQCGKECVTWGIKEYLKYGIVNYTIQMAIAVIWIVIIV